MMKLNSKILLPLLIVYGLILSAGTLAQQTTTTPQKYYAVAWSHCEEVSHIELSAEQIELWQNIKNIEVDMHDLHEPLQYLEERADLISEDIEYIAEQAISWEDGKLSLDLDALTEQTKMTLEISHLIASHAGEFEQLGAPGADIGDLIATFQSTLDESFADAEYKHISIYAEGEKDESVQCSVHA